MKKAWHPRTITNIEKVWKAEEEQREQQRRSLELKKKLEEERYHEELKRKQVELGILPQSSLDRLDFIYEVSGKAQKTTD